ncbi:hypothetical protein Tco_0703505 [Tanacetum coccineum]|uniref:Uncharacterized protein n=1 Tax=Tanacetum coccineum TaxID=301880 RepID=A0ABQ4XZ30_9ASTR
MNVAAKSKKKEQAHEERTYASALIEFIVRFYLLSTRTYVENLVPIPSEFEGISDETCDVPTCENNRVNVESDLVESLINPDFDPNDDTSSDDDSFENIEYVDASPSLSKPIRLRGDKPTPDRVLESLSPFPIPVADSDSFLEESDTFSHLDNSLPEFESFSDHTEETRSGSTTTHANYSLPEYESFHFDNPSFSRPPPEPPDVEICLHFEPDAPVIDNFNELNENQRGSEIIFIQNVEDDESFTFVIRTFFPFLTYPEASPLSCSTGSEDTIFDPGIITFPFSYLEPMAFSTKVSCSKYCSPLGQLNSGIESSL